MGFPLQRFQRLRRSEKLRALVRETDLNLEELILPLFVRSGKVQKRPIRSLPGHFQHAERSASQEIKACEKLGLGAALIFGVPENKDAHGSGAYDPEGVVARSIATIKHAAPNFSIIADVCLCQYTDHGHCGLLKKNGRSRSQTVIDNDATLELLGRTAVVYARAGADLIAPSDMMDGRVRAIRQALDEAGFPQTPILSYAAKFASNFYGPFRQAAGSAPAFGDRRGYQLDPANPEEALREIKEDIEEGADMVMVKPGLGYLDILYRAKQKFGVPIAAYQVSGEYAMIDQAARQGLLDRKGAVLESLICLKRAGADAIITYFAKETAQNRWIV